MRVPTLVAVLLACAAPPAALATVADDIPCTSSPPGPCVVATAVPVSPGSTLDFGGRGLVVTGAGELDAGGGTMVIKAASLVLQPGALLTSAGGEIDVTTTGNIELQAATNKAKVDVSGTTGGYITFSAGGDLVIAGQLIAAATVVQGDGGSIDVTGATVTLASSGKISAMGGGNGYGGDVSVSASTGSTIIAGVIDVSAGGDGGYISVDGNVNLTTYPGSVLNAKAGPGGSADSIDVTAYNGAVSLAGVIDNSAAGSLDLGGGSGGDVTVDAVTTLASAASINVSGGGTDGLAGSVDFETDGDILVRGAIDASASGTSGWGGLVSFETTAGTVDLGRNVSANGGGIGGEIDAFSFNTVRVSAGKLVADGPSARIGLEGCGVSVANVATLSSQGTNGVNLVQASGQMTIAGPLIAGLANRLEYLDATRLPVVSFAPVPAPSIVQNAQLIPCGGPTTTVTTSTSSTTTTTVSGPPTTTTTTHDTTTTLGAATTTTTAAPRTTTTTTAAPTSTTTTTTTTTTATTATSSTVTTTTARPPTSITVASTTTSTPPPTLLAASCVPANCDDGDDCTDDVCDPVAGCRHSPRPGLDLVSCRLDLLATALVVSPVADLGGTTARARYSAKVGKARRMVDAARRMKARREIAMLRRADHVLGGFSQAIRKAAARDKVRPDLAARLLELAASAATSLLALTQ